MHSVGIGSKEINIQPVDTKVFYQNNNTWIFAMIWRGSGFSSSLLEDVLLTVKYIIVAITNFAKKIAYCVESFIFGDNIVLSRSCITQRSYIIIFIMNYSFAIIVIMIALVAACLVALQYTRVWINAYADVHR